MKLTKSQLKQIIKEALLREGSDISKAFQPVVNLYNKAKEGSEAVSPYTNEQLEQLENQMISFWDVTIEQWRQDREDPDAWKRGY